MNYWRKIQISAPISLNNIYTNSRSGGRKKSVKYKSWIAQTQAEILSQQIEPVLGNYQIEIYAGKSTTRADIDNLIKPISDLLVKMGITEDDAKMMRCSSEFVTDRKNVLIMIKEYK